MSKALAGWALGVSIAGFLIGWVPLFGWLVWLVGLVLAIVAIVKCKKPKDGRGMAIAAIVINVVSLVFMFFMMIGALAYFGVLSPDNSLPNKCTISPEFACVDSQVNRDGSILIGIQNNAMTTLSEVEVTLTSSDCTLDTDTYTGYDVMNGERFGDGLIQFNCRSALNLNEPFFGDFSIRYVIDGESVMHTATGSLQRKVE